MTPRSRIACRAAVLTLLAGGLMALLPAGEAAAQFKGTVTQPNPKAAQPAPLRPRLAMEGVNESPGWAVRINVNRDDRTYKVGDLVEAEVVSEQDGYLYLFNIDAGNEISLLFPNGNEKENKIAANTPVKVAGPNAGFGLRVSDTNTGVEYLKAVVSKDKLTELDGAVKTAKPRQPIAITTDQFNKALREAAFRGVPNAPNSGNLTKDLLALKQNKIEVFTTQTKTWADAQIEIYTGPTGTQPTSQKRVALVIGIDKFKNPNIRPLGCAVKDADAIESMLRGVGKFTTVTKLTDDKATLDGIRAAFTKLVEGTRPGDTVLLYWSGHGGRCASTDPAETDGFAEYLVPHDGNLDSDAEIKKSMLMDKALGRWIQELDGRRVMVVLDTCHSGGQVEGMKFPAKIPTNKDGSPKFARGVNTPKADPKQKWTEPTMLSSELARYSGLRTRNIKQTDAAVLAACSPRQFAFEMRDETNGVLTGYVLECVRQASGPLTLEDVFTYVKDKVPAYVEKQFPGSPQNPVFSDKTARPAATFKP